MRTRHQYLGILLLCLICVGCRSTDRMLLEDHFSDRDGRWGTDSQEAFDRGYQDGEYFIELFEPNWLTWAWAGEDFTDVDIDVKAHQVSGASDGHFGVICRYNGPDTFYYFAITSDGYYAILLVEDEESQVLTGQGFVPSEAVLTDGAANQIRAVCEGDNLTLFVNSVEVVSVVDDTLSDGDVGIAAGSGAGGSLRVSFDDITVLNPTVQAAEDGGEGEGEE